MSITDLLGKTITREAAIQKEGGLGLGLMDAAKIALRTMKTAKLRAALTMLGIIIGVAAVIGVMSIGIGASYYISSQIESVGTNVVTIIPGAISQGGIRSAFGAQQTLTYEDYQALARPENVPDAMAVAPSLNRPAQVVAGPNNYNTTVVGTTPESEVIRNIVMASGRYITEQDLAASANVAVLGDTVAKQLFPDSDPVGQTIRINRLAFTVIGVMAPKGSNLFVNLDDLVVIPYTTAYNKLFGGRSPRGEGRIVTAITIKAADADAINRVMEEAAQVLRQRHNIRPGQGDDFSVLNAAELLSTFNAITTALTVFLSAIAAISLVVGGIGIMNIMLVSVTERTREIGIRKAVGARRRDILLQFLVESVILSVTGGVFGILGGIALAEAIRLTGLIQPLVSPFSVLLATLFAVAVGLFFGIYPAQRAARLDPVEALRYE